MTTKELMDDPEEDHTRWRVVVTPKEDITPEEIGDLVKFYEAAYGQRWVGEDHFRNVVMRNSSTLIRIYNENDLAASCNLNFRRITDIGVHPSFQGQGLGVKLFQEAAKFDPLVWISIGIDAEGMLNTITNSKLNFLPVSNLEEIEALFKELNGLEGDFKVMAEEVDLPDLKARIEDKGVGCGRFTTFYRPGSLHGVAYKQIVFQNQIPSRPIDLMI